MSIVTAKEIQLLDVTGPIVDLAGKSGKPEGVANSNSLQNQVAPPVDGFIDLSFQMPSGLFSASPHRSVGRAIDIVKGKVRGDLKEYVTGGKPMGRGPDGRVIVPVGGINPPRFIHGNNGNRGASAGDGKPGDALGPGQKQPGSGKRGKGGSEPGEHELLVEIGLDELTKMMAEELELPRIEPKDSGNVRQERLKWNTRKKTPADGVRHHKATYKEALKRTVVEGAASGNPYVPGQPIIPERPDRVNKAANPIVLPETQCDIVYLMDISGSMDGATREIAMQEAFWIEQFLKSQYPEVRRTFIAHDTQARLVEEDEFFRMSVSGGTTISSAYTLLDSVFKRTDATGINPMLTNTYVFQFSDGDNRSDDQATAIRALKEQILPNVNLFGYVQISNQYGSGDYLRSLKGAGIDSEHHENVVLSEVDSKEDIWDSLKLVLGKGR